MKNKEFFEIIKQNNEIWKEIPNYEELYVVSNLGRIVSLGKYVKQRNGFFVWKEPCLLKQVIKNGYCLAKLSKNGKSKTLLVHRVVASAFIPNPENKPQIDHIDCNKSNNVASNLRWCTAKENMQNPITKALIKKTHKGQKKKPVVALKNEKLYKIFPSLTSVNDFGYKHSSVYRTCIGKQHLHKGLKWYYLEDYQKLLSSSDFKELSPNG